MIAINDLKSLQAARSQQKIVLSDIVGHNTEQWPAAIRVENVAGRKIDRICVIDTASGGETFSRIRCIKGNEVGDLFSLEIGNGKQLLFEELKCDPALRFDPLHPSQMRKGTTSCSSHLGGPK